MPRSAVDRALLILSLLAAVVWFVAIVGHRDAGWLVVAKGVAIPALALIAARHGAVLLATALALHGVGDVLIEFSFPAGMAPFFLGHLLYLALFLRQRRTPIAKPALVRVVLFALIGMATLGTLAPHLEHEMAVAVPLYALALLLMACAAQLCGRGQPWLSVGAFFFVASDLLLALDKFGGGSPFGSLPTWPIWPTYWMAQALITWGWLEERS